MAEENVVKISNPERVSRILEKICSSGMMIVLRDLKRPKVGVRAIPEKMGPIATPSGKRVNALYLKEISSAGGQYLAGVKKIRVEFILMNAQVIFDTPILALRSGTALIQLPSSIFSIERRKNARVATRSDAMGFLRASLWSPAPDDPLAPPVYHQYSNMTGTIEIADVSVGGICVATRFPSVCKALAVGAVDDDARLLLPMQRDIIASYVVRWTKTLTEEITPEIGHARTITSYRFGIEFVDPSDELTYGIKQFIHTITQSDAI